MSIRWQGRGNGNTELVGSKGQVIKGAFHATLPGYGLAVNGNRQWIERGNADDGGVVLTTAGAYLFGSRRLLLTAAQTGSLSFFGGCDRLSIASDCSGSSSEMAGNWAMLEVKSGGKTGPQASCYRADLNIASGATVSAGVTSCFMAAAEKLSQSTTTGDVSVFHVPNPQAGTFTQFAVLGAATGCELATFTGNNAFVPNNKGTFTQCGQLKILIGSTQYYIPYGTVA